MRDEWRLGQKVKTVQRLDLDNDSDRFGEVAVLELYDGDMQISILFDGEIVPTGPFNEKDIIQLEEPTGGATETEVEAENERLKIAFHLLTRQLKRMASPGEYDRQAHARRSLQILKDIPDPEIDPYAIEWRGAKLDPYRIAELFGLGPTLAQALKKLLRMGRKHKSALHDAKEVGSTMDRFIKMREEDQERK